MGKGLIATTELAGLVGPFMNDLIFLSSLDLRNSWYISTKKLPKLTNNERPNIEINARPEPILIVMLSIRSVDKRNTNRIID